MSVKTQIKKGLSKLVTNESIDKNLASLAGRFPDSTLVRRIIPDNSLFPKDSKRISNRFGINFNFDISDYPDWSLYFHSRVDSSSNAADFTRLGNTVLDIGGNIGQTALMFAQKIGSQGKVYSFEPFPTTIGKFEQNLELNPKLDNIVLLKFALGEQNAILQMHQACETNSAANRIFHPNSDKNEKYSEIHVRRLDDFISEHQEITKIDLIKVDVEGFETSVLKGAKQTLQKFKPKLFIEVNDDNLKEQGSSSLELWSYLEGLNYIIFDAAGNRKLKGVSDLDEHTDIYCTITN